MHALIVDRGLLVALGAMYGLYGLWGALGLLTGVLPVRDLSGHEAELVWGALLMLLSWTITLAIARGADRVEVVVTVAWLTVVFLYPVSLIVRFIAGDLETPHILVLALTYLVIPAWRLSFLIRKINKRTREARRV